MERNWCVLAIAVGEVSCKLNTATHSCEKYLWDLATRNKEYVYILSLLYCIHINWLVHCTLHINLFHNNFESMSTQPSSSTAAQAEAERKLGICVAERI